VAAWFVQEDFTDEERARLAPHFTNLDGPVFALTNLPEVVKGARSRYRARQSLRRLFLDEFAEPPGSAVAQPKSRSRGRAAVRSSSSSSATIWRAGGGTSRASRPRSCSRRDRMGPLAAYLEQSTAHALRRPPAALAADDAAEIERGPAGEAYEAYATRAFEAYGRMFQPLFDLFAERFPKDPSDSDFLYRSTITAKTCDTLRVLLPAGTRSNLGVFATGQAYEQMLLRMRAHPLAEVREYADLMLVELRNVIPAFLKRVDLDDRGVAWSRYLAETREATAEVTAKFTEGAEPGHRETVTLTDYDPLGEEKVVAAAMYASSDLPDDRLQSLAHTMSPDERDAVLSAYVGERGNRRHKPGRAFERTGYRFDVLCDYGAFRDLQRHRLLTLEWQRLSPEHGFDTPDVIADAGMTEEWNRVMEALPGD
jgi:thymidylate synthase ThyX